MQRLVDKYSKYFSVESEQESLSLVRLSWPMMLENIMKYLITTVNTLIMSSYSDDAVAAVGVAGQVVNLVTTLYMAINVGIMVIISQSLGAGNKKRAQYVATVAVSMVVAIAAMVMCVVFVFYRQILTQMQLEDRLMADGSAYLVIVTAFTVFDGLINVISAIARSYGYTKVPMIVMTLMNALNALGSYLVINGPFSLPVTGVTGVAIARGCSTLISFIVLLYMVRKVPMGLTKLAFHSENKPWENVQMIFKFGMLSGLSNFSYMLSQTVATAILAKIGVVAVAAMIYVNNIVQYIKAFSLAISNAYEIMIGRLVGMGDNRRAEKMGYFCTGLCVLGNMIFDLVLISFRFLLLGLFTDSPDILQLAATVMMIDIIVEFFRAMNHGVSACLTVTGDVKFLVTMSIFSCWFLSIGFSWILGIVFGLGIYGCWIAFCMDECFRALTGLVRWRGRKWEKYGITDKEQ